MEIIQKVYGGFSRDIFMVGLLFDRSSKFSKISDYCKMSSFKNRESKKAMSSAIPFPAVSNRIGWIQDGIRCDKCMIVVEALDSRWV